MRTTILIIAFMAVLGMSRASTKRRMLVKSTKAAAKVMWTKWSNLPYVMPDSEKNPKINEVAANGIRGFKLPGFKSFIKSENAAHYKLNGKINAKDFAGNFPIGDMDKNPWVSSAVKNEDRPAGARKFADMANTYTNAVNKKYQGLANYKTIKYEGHDYDTEGGKRTIEVLYHTKKGAAAPKNAAALIYFHGGGAITSDAKDGAYIQSSTRYIEDSYEADKTPLVVFNANYRLAPENKRPLGILDCYATVKYVVKNAAKYGVDPKKIAFGGESGGGYTAFGVGMKLSEKNESHLVKLMFLSSAMTGNYILREDGKNLKGHIEKMWYPMTQVMFAYINGQKMNPFASLHPVMKEQWLFPNTMSAKIAAGLPKTVVITGEFDSMRSDSEETAALLLKNKKLLDFVVYPEVTHAFYWDMEHPLADQCWKDQIRMLKKWVM